MQTAAIVISCLLSMVLAAVAIGRGLALTRERSENHRLRVALEGESDTGKRQSRLIASLEDRITRGTAENTRLAARVTEVNLDRSRLETQLMHALATMDSANKKHIEVSNQLFDAEQRFTDRLEAITEAFKKTADNAFINAEELRAQNAGLLDTVKNATEQLVNISREFAGLRRVGFMRGAEVAVNTAHADEPAKFGSTSDADEAAAKTRGGFVTIDASE